MQVVTVDAGKQIADDYVAYAMAVNLGRALPHVLDGLKPSQRRVLYAMHDLGLASDKPFRKAARIDGEVMGRLHPHGSSFGTLVGMTNDWANRYALIDGQGNYGTTSDGPAAARYVEARLRPFSEQVLLRDLQFAETVPTYDNAWCEPVTLPTRLPMLLLRDTAGIGVAAACRHISYNIAEVAKLSQAALQGTLSDEDGLRYISMPDFAMGGQVVLSDGVRSAIATGSGSFKLRARLHVEDGCTVVATQLPQDVSPERVLEQTYSLLKEGTLLTRKVLADARDETDRSGTRVVWELKHSKYVPAFIALLWQRTDCQINVSVNAVSVDETSVSYSCKGVAAVANAWAKQRIATEVARLTSEHDKAQARLSILTGMLMAIDCLQQVIDALLADKDLCDVLPNLSRAQANAIEDMPLRSLRRLSKAKLEAEATQLSAVAAHCADLLAHRDKLVRSICKDVASLAKQFDDGWHSTAYEPLAEEQQDADLTSLAEASKPKQTYLLSNEHEGKPHTYYRSSSRVTRLQPVQVHEGLGVAVIMSNGSLYWLPAEVMPVDAQTAEPVKALLAKYTGKPWEPGTSVVWSAVVCRTDRSTCPVLPLTDGTGRKGKLLDTFEALAQLAEQKRGKSIWIGVQNAKLVPELEHKLQAVGVTRAGLKL